MPLSVPNLDDRRYQDLLDEALARVPVHTPEWTNFNQSDPGVTLISVFAFLTENLLYRCNQIPDRNRKKFLQLLGVPLQPAQSARGLVSFANERGPLATITLNDQLEVRSGQIPFRTEMGLDVLPVEAQVYYKQPLSAPSAQTIAYYTQLYASYGKTPPDFTQFVLYQAVNMPPTPTAPVDLGMDTVDGSLWMALLARTPDKNNPDQVREAIAGKTLNLGIVPYLGNAGRDLAPQGTGPTGASALLQFQVPKPPAGGILPQDQSQRVANYRTLDASSPDDVLAGPGVVQITLPAAADMILWSNLDPLEGGAGDFPPTLVDTNVSNRLITWIRVRSAAPPKVQLLWLGINTVFVTQKTRVAGEALPPGTGEPDQAVQLANAPVLPESVKISVIANGKTETWNEIDDITTAGPEVPSPNLLDAPGTAPADNPAVKVYSVDAESGQVHFGDGTRGARPPAGAILRADYDYGQGGAGNVGPGSISSSPALPAGLKVTNPIRTWGGTDAETVAEGEKQISRYLQHRDRMVNASDFETITLRTPGVVIGRVDVIATYNPELTTSEPGDAPGAVTLMVIPRYDPAHPAYPEPDTLFLDAICEYIDPRRLVTTEVILRGPDYRDIWISVGITVVAGFSAAVVREAVKSAISAFLSPLPPSGSFGLPEDPTPLISAPQAQTEKKGWPLRTEVSALELWAVATRVDGVRTVNDVLLAKSDGTNQTSIPMARLELPRIAGISVTEGDPVSLDALRGKGAPTAGGTAPFLPVPVAAEECK